MGFTADGQHDPAMVAERDKRFGIRARISGPTAEDIAAPPIDAAADAWQKDRVVQITDPTRVEHALTHSAKSAVRPPPSPTAASGSATPTK